MRRDPVSNPRKSKVRRNQKGGKKIETRKSPLTAFLCITGAGKSTVVRKMLDIEQQYPTVYRYSQSPRYTYTVPNNNKELDALNCLFQDYGASLWLGESLFSHIESHLSLLPFATKGSSELIREGLCSLQKAIHYVEEYCFNKKEECKDRNEVEDLLRHLHLALNELKRKCGKARSK